MGNSPLIPPPRASGFTASTLAPLYWARWGSVSAPKLLVLHGGPGADHDYLLPQMLALADEYEMVFYDQRGGGRSRVKGQGPVTWRAHVEDLALVASELITGPLTLVGYSWGGLLAMLYAVTAHHEAGSGRWPQVSRLLLIDPASVTGAHRRAAEVAFAERGEAEWVRSERAALSASGLREGDPAAFRKKSFELSVAGYFQDPLMASQLTPFRVANRVRESVWESLGDFDLRPGLRELRQLRVPALVIHGREDPIPLASSEEIVAALGARLVVLDDCGHVPYIERPAALFAAMRSFLKDPASVLAE